MPPWAVRVTAVVCALLGIAAYAVVGLSPTDHRVWWKIRVGAIVLLSMLLFLLVMGWRARGLPVTFQVTPRRAFAAGPAVQSQSVAALVWLLLPGLFAVTMWYERPEDGQWGWPVAIAAAASALSFTVPRPMLVLTPDGLVLRKLLRKTRVGWDSMLAWATPYPGNGGLWVRRRGRRPLSLPIDFLAIDPAFLDFALNHYIKQPERRAHIGEQAELQRLQSAYREWDSLSRVDGGAQQA